MRTLPPEFSVMDPTFPSGYVAADHVTLGVPPPLGSLEISHTRHTLERLAAGRGISPSIRGQLGSVFAPHRVLPAVGDLLCDLWRRRSLSGPRSKTR